MPTSTTPVVGGSRLSLAEYLSAIPDGNIRGVISQIALAKLKETHSILDWLTKALWHLSHECPGFLDKMIQNVTKSNDMVASFQKVFRTSTLNEQDFFQKYLKKGKYTKGYKKDFAQEIRFEEEFTANKTLSTKLEEIRDLADYRHHIIMQKLAIKRFSPAPVIQDMKKIAKIDHFDNMHKDSVNCIDICPFGKILASASSDGTIKFIDLEDMSQIRELLIKDNHGKRLRSVCLDDKHNVAYVNEDNVLRIYNLNESRVIAEYKGDSLLDLTDLIPNQACQFTSDFNYLAFRAASNKIILFDMLSKGIVKEIIADEKINDFTISPQRDYIALAIYSECKAEIISISDGKKVAEYKLDSNLIL
jgi:WD40 repeat protein